METGSEDSVETRWRLGRKTQPEARTTWLCLHSFELLSEKKNSKECIILTFNHMLFMTSHRLCQSIVNFWSFSHMKSGVVSNRF